MQLTDIEPTLVHVKNEVNFLQYKVSEQVVVSTNDTSHNRAIVLKELINRILNRYCIYKSDIKYNSSAETIDFEYVIYINKNTYTITISNKEIITQTNSYSISEIIRNPSIIEKIISEIDSDLYILTYMNS